MKVKDCVVGRLYLCNDFQDNGIYLRVADFGVKDGMAMVNLDGFGGSRLSCGWSYKPLSELEELVFWANFGEKKAQILIEKYPNQVEYSKYSKENYQSIDCTQWGSGKYRIKEKSFTIEEGHEVKIQGDKVYIGCKEFSKNLIHKILESLCKGGGTRYDGFYSGRKGIMHEGNTISWKSADKILEALNDENNN